MFESDKSDIEKNLGKELVWKGGWNIQIKLRGEKASINDPPEKLDKVRNWMFDHLLKLKQVFDPRLEEIMSQSPPEEG